MAKYRFPFNGWVKPKDMQVCIDQLNDDCADFAADARLWRGRAEELAAQLAEHERLANDLSWAEYLETVAVGLGMLLDDLSDLDDLTVGEVKRLKVLAESVRDGAKAVLDRVWPHAHLSFTATTTTIPNAYVTWNRTVRDDDAA